MSTAALSEEASPSTSSKRSHSAIRDAVARRRSAAQTVILCGNCRCSVSEKCEHFDDELRSYSCERLRCTRCRDPVGVPNQHRQPSPNNPHELVWSCDVVKATS